MGQDINILTQIGFVVLVGLAAKNAILIVEFARELQHKEGMGPVEAAMEASRLRLRPILMTSLAFILGVMPLAISNGAGSASQHAIGTGVIGGMLTATFLAIFFIPMFFVVIRAKFSGETEDADEAARLAQAHHAPKPEGDDGDNSGAGGGPRNEGQ
jgi:multidrug efflux pump